INGSRLTSGDSSKSQPYDSLILSEQLRDDYFFHRESSIRNNSSPLVPYIMAVEGLTCCLTEYHKNHNKPVTRVTAFDINPEGQRCQLNKFKMAHDSILRASHL